MKTRLLSLIFTIFIFNITNATTIRGSVTANEQPIIGAEVLWHNTGFGTTSNLQGYFELKKKWKNGYSRSPLSWLSNNAYCGKRHCISSYFAWRKARRVGRSGSKCSCGKHVELQIFSHTNTKNNDMSLT